MSSQPNFLLEKSFWQKDQLVVGLDEVGRGALAGPVTVAAVIFPPHLPRKKLSGVNDSKKLTPTAREKLVPQIKKFCLHFSLHSIDHQTIDRLNITAAIQKAMRASLKNLPPADHLLLDAFPLPYARGYPQRTHQTAVKNGDQRSFSIAAASILAKVHRDILMQEYHQLYPAYHWYANKGYGTKKHRQALKNQGPSPLHRRTFIKNFLS